ncbi:LacI family DNA-binding transcriptional regulator [Bacillus mycoides]|uniref:LacI family DNA-binding transcriptional regulator n=1 Tax=Bacillus mycoides TaxID=1405 RepID=UPI001C020F3F|nr:LacI family DNA-binding transcriptional regulator [Bacillus mycoides]QWG61449.1 LacI family DNA-binding transcriptional regulator [Bacillus mycoides]QWG92542.1 LacI family DNA-binding transcriptional regulator [Bacillus mycoides]QWJ06389.1 LacI family DNA-binding transcriptional regulator [Bacillus mycoides]
MTNIRKIAELAGVSVSTVSRVLNNHPYVNEQKRKEILAIIEELNYTQNVNAIHLVKGKTNVIGVLLPHVNDQYYSAIIGGISKETAKNNYNMMLCQTNYSEEKELEILHMLKMKKLDGVIICSRTNSKEKLEEYTKFGPIVMCEEIDSNFISSVHIDYYKVFLRGMKSLIDAGHTRIGYCIGRSNSINSQRRKKAYEDSLQQIVVTPLDAWKFKGCFTVEDGRNVVREWARMSVKPTAFLVSCNHIAAGIVTEAKKQGIRIPEDITIIGCDDQEVANILGITTISHSSKNVGVKAFELLYEKINDEEIDVKHVELLPNLVDRETT